MVIEANRDAARECIKKAEEALLRKDVEKMRNFLAKAKKLDPDCDVEKILRNGSAHEQQQQAEPERSYSHDDHYDDTSEMSDSNIRHRKSGSSASSGRNGERVHNRSEVRQQPSTSGTQRMRSRSKSRTNVQADVEYTKEDFEMVQRIKHCKDYYEILQVTRDFSESQLRKKYYELALKLHPDKCKVPGSTEAFKALGNAYGVLSDAKKREEYDRYGTEDQRAAASRHRHEGDFYEYDVGRGFESEMSPEDIFEMFFGGGFARTSMNRRRTQFFHTHVHREDQRREETSPFFQLLQILPIIVIIFGGLIMQLFIGEPAYSLHRDSTYYVQRYTKDLRVPYFVKPDFEAHYSKRIRQVEQHVEDEYLTMIRTNCYREKNQRDSLLWTAKLRGDAEMWRRAQETEMTFCRKLDELYR